MQPVGLVFSNLLHRIRKLIRVERFKTKEEESDTSVPEVQLIDLSPSFMKMRYDFPATK